jgi:hypothetical protein
MEINNIIRNYRYETEIEEWSHSRITVNLHKNIGITAKRKSSRNNEV